MSINEVALAPTGGSLYEWYAAAVAHGVFAGDHLPEPIAVPAD